MSKILKGLNEVNPNNYDSDWDYQDAVAKSGKSRSSYRSQEDDTSDADIAYSKKMYQLGQKQKVAKEKAQRDADHDRLASGTNEGMMPIGGNSTSTDRRKVMDLLQVYYKSMGGDFWEWFNQPGNKEFFAKRAGVSPDSAYEVVDSINWGQHPQEEWPEDEEEQLNELSNKKLGKYKTAAGKDASKADSEGDYKRGDKRYKGITTATKKEFANDAKQPVKEDINVVYSKAKSLLTQLDENTQQRVINALKKSVVKEFEGDIETITAPTSNNQPSRGFAIKVHGPLGTSPRLNGIPAVTLWEGLSAVFPDKYPPKDYQNLGAQLDSPQAKVFNQIQRAGSAVVASGIASRDLAETLAHKLATYKPTSTDYEGIGPIGKKFVEVIEQGMAEADEKPVDPFKTGYPRVNNPKILGTQNRAKSAYHPPARPPIKKLDKPLPENLGNELKSKSLEALQQVKQQLEQQRMADLEQWEKDFKQNTVAKFTAREPNLRQRATSTSMVAMPGEKHSELKTRLGQLNKAIEKQGILDNLVQKLDKKGLMTPNIEAGVDTSMLARDGARDNYVELNRKLDKALEYVKNRLLTNKAAYAKPKAIDEDDGVPTRMRMNDYLDLADAIQEKLRHAIQMGDKARIQELNKQRDELDAHVKKHGMMPEAIDEEQLDELSCWSGYHRVAGTKAGFPGSCAKNKTNEEGVAEGKLNFEEGDCPIFAIALHRLSKMPLMALVEYDEQMGSTVLIHAYVKLDDRWRLDATGETDVNWMLQKYPNNGDAEEIEISEKDLLELGYGKSKCPTLQQVLPHAKEVLQNIEEGQQGVAEEQHSCPHCGGEMVSEELMNEKKDACYYKVKSRYKVWPSAYASGALVKCRKSGADSWGNGGKKNESSILEGIERADESLHDWFNKEKWVRMDTKGNIKGPCAKEPGEGKPKCLPQAKAHSLGKKGRASAAQRKRREDPNPERSGKAINVNTKKKD